MMARLRLSLDVARPLVSLSLSYLGSGLTLSLSSLMFRSGYRPTYYLTSSWTGMCRQGLAPPTINVADLLQTTYSPTHNAASGI